MRAPRQERPLLSLLTWLALLLTGLTRLATRLTWLVTRLTHSSPQGHGVHTVQIPSFTSLGRHIDGYLANHCIFRPSFLLIFLGAFGSDQVEFTYLLWGDLEYF